MNFIMRNGIKLMRMLTGWVLVTCMLVCNSSGMVLCIGDNGHLAVEPVHQEHCHLPSDETGQTHHDENHSTQYPAENNNGGCVDVPLDLDKVSQVVKDVKLGHLLKGAFSKELAASYMVEFYEGGRRIQFLTNKAPPEISQSLLVQRTIVLRL